MAGSAVPSYISHRSRGVVRTDATLTCDASGSLTAAVVGVGFGRLVGVIVKPTNAAIFGAAAPVITLSDTKTGAAIVTYNLLTNIATFLTAFGSTTTGDTTGGASEDLWTTGTAHGLSEGDSIIFTAIAGNTSGGPTLGTPYYVVKTTGFGASTFCLSDTAAHALAGTNIVNVGSTDASSATWYALTVAGVAVTAPTAAVFFRPTQVVTDNAGTAVTAADTAPNVNRNITLAGKVSVAVAAGAAGTALVSLIIDEKRLGETALTV